MVLDRKTYSDRAFSSGVSVTTRPSGGCPNLMLAARPCTCLAPAQCTAQQGTAQHTAEQSRAERSKVVCSRLALTKHYAAGHSWTGLDRAGQGRAGQGRAGQGRAGQGRAGQGTAGQGRAQRGITQRGTAMLTCSAAVSSAALGLVGSPHTQPRQEGDLQNGVSSFTCPSTPDKIRKRRETQHLLLLQSDAKPCIWRSNKNRGC